MRRLSPYGSPFIHGCVRMWRVEVLDKHRDLLFKGWFATAADAGEFIENTLELFLLQQARFYAISHGDRRLEYSANDAADCVFANRH